MLGQKAPELAVMERKHLSNYRRFPDFVNFHRFFGGIIFSFLIFSHYYLAIIIFVFSLIFLPDGFPGKKHTGSETSQVSNFV